MLLNILRSTSGAAQCRARKRSTPSRIVAVEDRRLHHLVASEGRAFPVETRYLGRDANARIEDQMADAVMRALRADSGSILAFLPGQGEIRRGRGAAERAHQ